MFLLKFYLNLIVAKKLFFFYLSSSIENENNGFVCKCLVSKHDKSSCKGTSEINTRRNTILSTQNIIKSTSTNIGHENISHVSFSNVILRREQIKYQLTCLKIFYIFESGFILSRPKGFSQF